MAFIFVIPETPLELGRGSHSRVPCGLRPPWVHLVAFRGSTR